MTNDDNKNAMCRVFAVDDGSLVDVLAWMSGKPE